jgi:methionyl-tRNA synthetase
MLAEEGALFGEQKVETYQESERDHIALTYDPAGAVGSWQRVEVEVGRHLPKPGPLFKKLDQSVVEDELARLGR